MNSDRRFIEAYIPIREISAEASREKSIRQGHLFTLHLPSWASTRPILAGGTVGTAYVKAAGKAGRIGIQPLAVVCTKRRNGTRFTAPHPGGQRPWGAYCVFAPEP